MTNNLRAKISALLPATMKDLRVCIPTYPLPAIMMALVQLQARRKTSGHWFIP